MGHIDYNYQAAATYAIHQLGKPYIFGAKGPQAFDCSGLTMMALAVGGKRVDHNAGAQAEELYTVEYTRENKNKLRAGDVIFWYGTIKHPLSIGHCGLYLGREGSNYMCVSAVDEQYGVIKHRLEWALRPCGLAYVGHF